MRSVGTHLVVDVLAPARLSIQVAVANPTACIAEEQIRLTVDDREVAFTEVAAPSGGRIWVVDIPGGTVDLDYQASVRASTPTPATELAEELVYLRPSRYCESDRIVGMASRLFRGIEEPFDVLVAVSSWVGQQLEYVSGSSGPTDGAVDTLLAGRGVCRDYAHLAICLLRALGIPARLAAVYAPGLHPMDFHAVAEAMIGSAWFVVDGTLLAPRSALVRIATGRDAADTSFLSSDGGAIVLTSMEVRATVDGTLPTEDVSELLSLS